MAIPTTTISSHGTKFYAESTGAILRIESAMLESGVGPVLFYAFLTDFSQNYTSNWQTEEVFGRTDPIATFQGTKRSVTLAWDIPAAELGGSPQ